MLNYIWAALMITGLLVAGLVGRLSGDAGVINAAFNACKTAVLDLALPLAGMMMFWLGTLRLLEKAGILEMVTRLLAPVLRRLFPEVPAGHPALGAMVMNWCANMLGLGNAATPMGLKAMGHLQEINPHKQSASNPMVTFLGLNTSGFALIPMTAIIYLNTAGVPDASRIIVPAILATALGTIAAVIAAKFYQRLPVFAQPPDEAETAEGEAKTEPIQQQMSGRAKVMLGVLAGAFVFIAALELGPPQWREDLMDQTGLGAVIEGADQRAKESEAAYEEMKKQSTAGDAAAVPAPEPLWKRMMNGASGLAIPAVLLIAISLALARRVKVYEEFVEGAKEGFGVATRIMPFLVAMLAMLAVVRASGVFALMERGLGPVLSFLGFPVELLSLALMRPLSGSGASGILTEILTRPDLTMEIKYTAAILYGSTETTFYVLAVYFGSVGVKKIRHALATGLTADFVGMAAAITIGKLLF
jgi:spore maturation protein SpmA